MFALLVTRELDPSMAYKAARLMLDDTAVDLPIVNGTDGRQHLDISSLRRRADVGVFDDSLNNTAISESAITWIDQKNGKLLYRGYPIEELVEHSSFVETSFLLSRGHLPNADEYREFSISLSKHSMIHEAMKNFYDAFPGDAHPLAILSVMVTSLSSYYPATYEDNIIKGVDVRTRLLAKIRTLAAWSYKKYAGEPIIYPRDEFPYCVNYLNMMFANPVEPYNVPPEHDALLNKILILYSDHEQNVATTTVRLVGSTEANLFACISAGMCALWGSRESGARVPPVRMLHQMIAGQQAPEQYFEKFIKGTEPMLAVGLGHANYEVTDPRAAIAKRLFHEYLKKHTSFSTDPLIVKALEVEEFSLGHPFFLEKRLYPNLDFYTGLLMHMLGIPPQMQNATRSIGKTAGWLAHWDEQRLAPPSFRPQQVYKGEQQKKYVPLTER